MDVSPALSNIRVPAYFTLRELLHMLLAPSIKLHLSGLIENENIEGPIMPTFVTFSMPLLTDLSVTIWAYLLHPGRYGISNGPGECFAL